mmetsp:Transcript_55328/g.131396  ORF Transcript_55328/g.131396 Transcript_55328/m.131396 type:complete len:224 (-) Transcript_55328:65-736(-)
MDRREHLLIREHAARARLGHENGPLAHLLPCERLVEALEVELDARAALDRVANVHDHHVKLGALVVLEERECVLIVDLESRVFVDALVPGGEVLPALLACHLVQVHHHHLLDRRPLKDFPCRRPLAPPSNEHPLGAAVGEHRRVDQRLMIRALVECGGLRVIVQHQRLPERHSLNNLDALVLGLALEEDGGERHLQHELLRNLFFVPEGIAAFIRGERHPSTC